MEHNHGGNRRGFLLIALIAVLIVNSMLLSGCVQSESEKQVEKDKFIVVTSFYPLYAFTSNIVDGVPGVELMNLTQPQTGCLHDYQMKPSDMSSLEDADLFIVNGAGMENFLGDVRKTYPNLRIVEASENIKLLKDENGQANPHVWVSVTNAIYEVKNITDALKQADENNEKAYEKNEEAYLNRLSQLKAEMHKSLDSFSGREIVTFHEAFPYFAEEFGLKIAAVIEREPGSEPSAAELGATIDIVNASGVKCLFSEPQYSGRSADVISRETGAKIYNLDPFVTGLADGKKDAYEIVMRNNLKVLNEAFK